MDISFDELRQKKIFIIGRPGAGKTTLAKKLGSILETKVYHLDRFFWGPDWKGKDCYERMEILDDLVLNQGPWIIEGSYILSSEPGMKVADIIIFLDLNRLLCLCRVFKRHKESCKRPRRDIPERCRDKISLRRLWKVLTYSYNDALDIRRLQDKYEHNSIREFRSKKPIEDFLTRLVNEKESSRNNVVN